MCRLFFIAIIEFGFAFQGLSQARDTVFVRRLVEKSQGVLMSNPDSSLIYADSVYREAKKIDDVLGIADSYNIRAGYHWLKGNFSEAITMYDSALEVYHELNRPERIQKGLLGLGMSHSRLGNYSKGVDLLLRALRIAEKLRDKKVMASIYTSLSVAYKNNKKLDEAFDASYQALAIYKEMKLHGQIAGCFVNIGNIYDSQKKYPEALSYHEKALAIFDSLQNYRGIIICYNNISEVLLELGDIQEAFKTKAIALKYSREKGLMNNLADALDGMGRIQVRMNNFDEAEKLYLEAIELSRMKGYRNYLISHYKGLSSCYKQQKKYELALKYLELYTQLNDSIYNDQSIKTISDLQTSYEFEKKEAAIQLLKKDSEIATLNRNRTIFAALSLIAILGLTIGLQLHKQKKDRKIHEQQQKLQKIEHALIESELNMSRKKEEALLKEINYKNKALTTYALSMVQKNELLEEVKQSVDAILKKKGSDETHLKKLSKVVDVSQTMDKDWEDFRLYFEEVHTNFFSKLSEKYPELSASDLRLCALIQLQLSMKQVAAVLRISPDSVKIARYRLRKKFNLQTEDNLTSFLMTI